LCLVQVVGDNGSGESVAQVVGRGDHVLVVAPRHHRHHGIKNFLPGDPHLWRDAVEYGRGDEKAVLKGAVLGRAAAGQQVRSLRRIRFDVAYDPVVLSFGDDGADLVAFDPRQADGQGLGLSNQFRDHRYTQGFRAR
jgi:hypothetical protein